MYKMPEGRTGRSVNDYKTPEELKEALRSMKRAPSALELSSATKQDYIAHREPKPDPHAITAVGNAVVEIDEDLDWVIDGYDRENSEAPSVEKEMRRLAVLKSYRLIGSGRDPGYERLISLTSRIFKVPMALISIIDLGRLHLLASRGMGEIGEIPRKSSICAHAIISKLDLLVIPDLSQDPRFQDEDIVTGDTHLRFYAAAPLTCPEGYRLGALCILDTEPRPGGLSLPEKQNLRELADMVMDVMVEHRERKNHKFRHPAQMIASTSNDLMIPLKGVVSGLSTIKSDSQLLDTLSKQQKEVFNTAVTCSTVMNRICKKSLEMFYKERRTVSKTIAQDDSSTENLVNVRDLVKHLHMVMDPFPKQVPLIITTDPQVPEVVVADDLKIFRSVVNFLTNACAITEIGSVHLKISVETDESEDNAKSLTFTVEDTGPGISVEKYQYLFKPTVEKDDPLDSVCSHTILSIAKTEASKAAVGRGGLGLYSVATQIESLGGKYGFRPRSFNENGSECFDANGNPLSGSVFWFSIPLVLPDGSTDGAVVKSSSKRKLDEVSSDVDDSEAKESSSEGHYWSNQDEAASLATEGNATKTDKRNDSAVSNEVHNGQRKKRALLIEDSQVCRKTMSRVLTKLGFEVTLAVNGLEGLKEMHQTLFDIVFCDFLMPVMDGMDCVQQYRQFEVAHRPWFDQFIIGMSAHASDKDIERGLRVGMNLYRPKPVNMKIIKDIMASPDFMVVTSRLDALDAELQDEDAKNLKRQKLSDSKEEKQQKEANLRVCLIAEEGDSISVLAEKAAEGKGWKSIVVHDGEAALRLLQMRNWDAVLLDDELPGLTSSRCIAHFRDWEKNNRVNRQKNVLQISSSFIPSQMETSSSMQLPSGFDGAIGKPLTLVALQTFLDKAADGTTCASHDIVSR